MTKENIVILWSGGILSTAVMADIILRKSPQTNITVVSIDDGSRQSTLDRLARDEIKTKMKKVLDVVTVVFKEVTLDKQDASKEYDVGDDVALMLSTAQYYSEGDSTIVYSVPDEPQYQEKWDIAEYYIKQTVGSRENKVQLKRDDLVDWTLNKANAVAKLKKFNILGSTHKCENKSTGNCLTCPKCHEYFCLLLGTILQGNITFLEEFEPIKNRIMKLYDSNKPYEAIRGAKPPTRSIILTVDDSLLRLAVELSNPNVLGHLPGVRVYNSVDDDLIKMVLRNRIDQFVFMPFSESTYNELVAAEQTVYVITSTSNEIKCPSTNEGDPSVYLCNGVPILHHINGTISGLHNFLKVYIKGQEEGNQNG